MKAFVIGDDEPTTRRVRDVLLQAGHDCPAGHVLAVDRSSDATAHAPELLVVAAAPDADRALAAVTRLHAATPAPVLVLGPTGESQFVLRAMRAGAADVIDEADLEADLADAVARLGAAVPRGTANGRLIAVLSPGGGSGASTVAANVATVLAAKYKSALLVDLKLFNGDLAALLDLRPAHTLADLCQSAGRLDRTMFERSLARHANGVHLLAPPRWFPDAALVTPDGVRHALALGRGLFPFVVADLDNTFAPEQVQVVRDADAVLLVLRLDFASLRNAQRTLEYLERLEVPRDRVRVVANRYGQPKEVPPAKAEQALGVRIGHYVPEDAKAVNRANNNGVPVVTESPSARVSKSLTALAVSVNGKKP